jgi:hypothetical protein
VAQAVGCLSCKCKVLSSNPHERKEEKSPSVATVKALGFLRARQCGSTEGLVSNAVLWERQPGLLEERRLQGHKIRPERLYELPEREKDTGPTLKAPGDQS